MPNGIESLAAFVYCHAVF